MNMHSTYAHREPKPASRYKNNGSKEDLKALLRDLATNMLMLDHQHFSAPSEDKIKVIGLAADKLVDDQLAPLFEEKQQLMRELAGLVSGIRQAILQDQSLKTVTLDDHIQAQISETRRQI